MFLLLKKRDGYQRQPPRFIQLFPLRTTLIIVFLLCTRLEEIIHICLHGVDDPHLLFELCSLIIEPLLLVEKTLLFGLKGLQARQFLVTMHGKQRTLCRLEDHKLGRMIIGLVLLTIGDPSFRKGRGGTNFVGAGGIPNKHFSD